MYNPPLIVVSFFFFFNDTATTEIYTLPLHDALPIVPGSIATFGGPVGAVDRHGTFYYAGLGADASARTTIQVNRSTDGGHTWSDAVVVQQDNGGDKDWMAVGPDPGSKNRDNVYVTW